MTEIIIGVLILLGSFFVFVAGFGLLRMPDLYIRMHAATKAGTLGVGFTVAAVAVFYGTPHTVVVAIVIFFFFLLTAPVGAHILGRASYVNGVKPWEKTVQDELAGCYDVDTHQLASDPEESQPQATIGSTT
ncbi:MAG: monovalent cation/H(+) antiporter subunit G [Trueperaceae bacterium]